MKTAYYKYFSALLLFGSNGVIASNIALPSYEIVLLRTLIGSLFLLVVFKFSGQQLTFYKNKRSGLFLCISAIAMGASWMLLYEAYQHVGVSIASLAYYCEPVIVMILAPLLFNERLTWAKAAGFASVLLGAFFVNWQALDDGKTVWGLFCGGMSAIMYAIMVIFNKKTQNISGAENSLVQLFVGFLVVATFIGFNQGLTLHHSAVNWMPVLLLGLLNTGLGCYLYFSSITVLPVQTVAICGYLEPLAAVFFSVFLLHESLQPLQILGAILIISGAVFSECAEQSNPDQPKR